MMVNFVVLQFSLILSLYCLKASATCSFPCSVQLGGSYENELGSFEFSCQNSSLLIRSRGKQKEIQECYARNGPFTVLRRNNFEYQCVKEVAVQGKITWIYETKFIKMFEPPTVCSICTPKLMIPRLYATPGLPWKLLKHLKPPPLGCNRPKNCPISTKYDKPCLGCEPYDDGYCCLPCGDMMPSTRMNPFFRSLMFGDM